MEAVPPELVPVVLEVDPVVVMVPVEVVRLVVELNPEGVLVTTIRVPVTVTPAMVIMDRPTTKLL